MLASASAAVSGMSGSAIRDLLAVATRPGVLSLAGGLPATDLIPRERIAAEIAARLADPLTLQYTQTCGDDTARARIAAYAGVAPAEILLVNGSQQALSLLATALVDPGDIVVVDEPCYVGARQAFESVRARLESIPLGPDGFDVEELQRRLVAGLRPRLVHTVGRFHNPGGVSLPADARARLLGLAERYGFWVVDDDPYGAIDFTGGQARSQVGDGVESPALLRLGSASKVLAPALRVGWLCAPAEVITVVERLRQSVDLCGSTLAQRVVGELLADRPWLDTHLAGLRAAYAERANALVAALRRRIPDARFTEPTGGMFVWVRLPGVDTSALLPAAVDAGMAFVPGAAFAVTGDLSDRMRLSYATLPPGRMDEAMTRLADVLQPDRVTVQ